MNKLISQNVELFLWQITSEGLQDDRFRAAKMVFMCHHPWNPSWLPVLLDIAVRPHNIQWGCFTRQWLPFPHVTVFNILCNCGFLPCLHHSFIETLQFPLTKPNPHTVQTTAITNVQQWQINLLWEWSRPAYQVAVGERRGWCYHRNRQFAVTEVNLSDSQTHCSTGPKKSLLFSITDKWTQIVNVVIIMFLSWLIHSKSTEITCSFSLLTWSNG